MKKQLSKDDEQFAKNDFDYCRTCYRHLAGYVGVTISEAMEEQGYVKKSDAIYLVTKRGWDWLSQFDISERDYKKSRRAMTCQCLDRSERRPHLAGQIGTVLLDKMLENRWFEKVESSRELIVTRKGRQSLNDALGIVL